jgi:hypothetical protein
MSVASCPGLLQAAGRAGLCDALPLFRAQQEEPLWERLGSYLSAGQPWGSRRASLMGTRAPAKPLVFIGGFRRTWSVSILTVQIGGAWVLQLGEPRDPLLLVACPVPPQPEHTSYFQINPSWSLSH